MPDGTQNGVIGVNLMHLGGPFDLDPGFRAARWRETCVAMLAGLRKLGPLRLIAHDEAGARFLESLAADGEEVTGTDRESLERAYSGCAAVVGNHVQGVMYAAGCGVPGVVIGNDTQALSAEVVGVQVERGATVEAGAVVERVRGLLARRAEGSARLVALRGRVMEQYSEIVKPVLDDVVRKIGTRSQGSDAKPSDPWHEDSANGAAGTGSQERKLAFITGCGRSGTTILGRILEHHGQVRYFNDRFDLWVRPFPRTDIWGYHPQSALAMPRVALDEEDARVTPEAREWFLGLMEKERGDRPVLVEKLAINNFRLGFITGLCPEAYLVNIVRHGVEVAYSIAAKAGQGQWYGENDRKWRLMAEYAWAHGYGELLRWCETPYHKGLLEWRMSVEAAEKFFAGPGAAFPRVLHLRYEELLGDPASVCARLQKFLGLAPSEGMLKFAIGDVKRQNPAAKERAMPRGTEEIAGVTLRRLGYWA